MTSPPLDGIRRQDLRCPVIVFGSGEFADENKIAALRRGAVAYCGSFQSLFQTLQHVLSPGEPREG